VSEVKNQRYISCQYTAYVMSPIMPDAEIYRRQG